MLSNSTASAKDVQHGLLLMALAMLILPGIDGITKYLSDSISPGEIETAMIGPEYKALAAEIPMGRLGRPEEVASLIYFLCSEPAAYVNGAEIHVNGGQHV